MDRKEYIVNGVPLFYIRRQKLKRYEILSRGKWEACRRAIEIENGWLLYHKDGATALLAPSKLGIEWRKKS